jgi:phage shock protein A
MTLIARVSRLFKADLHAVLDRVEEPDLVLRQAIREMEEDLARDGRSMEIQRSELQRIAARDAELERSLAGIEEELDICFEAGKDELGRALIRRRLEGQSYRASLSQRREGLEEKLAGLQKRVRDHGARLEEMRQKAEMLAPREAAEPMVGEAWDTPDLRVRDEDVEVAFLRERQRRARS